MIALKSDKPYEAGGHVKVKAVGWSKQAEVGAGSGDPPGMRKHKKGKAQVVIRVAGKTHSAVELAPRGPTSGLCNKP